MSITSRINEMSSHIEQAYDELQGLGADLTNVNKNIENISMVLDDIYDSMPQVSGEGTSLTLDDTRVGKIKITLKGNTSQTTYSGKNILPNDTETKTRNGITITKNSDGTYKVNGTATSDVSEAICNSFIPMSGTWRMLGCPSGGSASTYMLSAYVGYWGEGSPNIDTGSGTNITYTGNVKVRFYIKSGTTCNNLIFKPMLTTDTSTTINDFEPYVGGTPSPNPSYPQPVNVVSGDNYIDICGKNLFNSEVVQGFYTADGNISASNTQIRTTEYMEVEPNTIYTFSNTNNLVIDRICYYNSSKTFIERGVYLNSGTFTTLNNNCKYIRFTIRASDGSNITPSSLVKPMLEKGSTATTYEPHIGNSYPLYLGVEELFDKDNANILNAYFETSTPNLSSNDNARTLYIECSPNTTYTIEKLRSQQFNVGCTSTQPVIDTTIQKIENGTTGVYDGTTKASYTYTTNSTAKYLLVRYAYATQVDLNLMLSSIKIQKGNKINHASTTPIELCKIGNYQDYFYKDSGKWYLHKEIGKVVLNGTETNWAYYTDTSKPVFYYSWGNNEWIYKKDSIWTCFNELYKGQNITATFDNIYNYGNYSIAFRSQYPRLVIRDDRFTTTSDFKDWLSTHNTEVYYVYANPTTIDVEYQPLIDQLNLLEKAMSKDGQTNISQVNNDLPFIISASALKEWQESTSLNSTLSMVNPLSLGNTLNAQENNTQPIEVDNIEPLEEEENE